MRKTWLALVVVLACGAPLAAQQAQPRAGTWATNRAPQGGTTYVLVTAPPVVNQPQADNAPMAVLAVPVVAQPAAGCAGGGCASGCCGKPKPVDWACLRDWLCYQPLRGGCGKCEGACGCSCSIPLYVYFKGCKEGRHFELPPCVAEQQNKPGLLSSMVSDGRAKLGSVGSLGTCPPGGCKRTSPLFGRAGAGCEGGQCGRTSPLFAPPADAAR